MNFVKLEIILFLRNKKVKFQFFVYFLLVLIISLNSQSNSLLRDFFETNRIVSYLILCFFISGYLNKFGTWLFSWHSAYFELFHFKKLNLYKWLKQEQLFYGIFTLLFATSSVPFVVSQDLYIEAVSIFVFTCTVSFYFFAISQSNKYMNILIDDEKGFNIPYIEPGKLYLGLINIVPLAVLSIGEWLGQGFYSSVLIVIISLMFQLFLVPMFLKKIVDNLVKYKYRNRSYLTKQRIQ